MPGLDWEESDLSGLSPEDYSESLGGGVWQRPKGETQDLLMRRLGPQSLGANG